MIILILQCDSEVTFAHWVLLCVALQLVDEEFDALEGFFYVLEQGILALLENVETYLHHLQVSRRFQTKPNFLGQTIKKKNPQSCVKMTRRAAELQNSAVYLLRQIKNKSFWEHKAVTSASCFLLEERNHDRFILARVWVTLCKPKKLTEGFCSRRSSKIIPHGKFSFA